MIGDAIGRREYHEAKLGKPLSRKLDLKLRSRRSMLPGLPALVPETGGGRKELFHLGTSYVG